MRNQNLELKNWLTVACHAYDADFLQALLKNKDIKLIKTFHLPQSLNNSRFGDYLQFIYPKKHEVNDPDTQKVYFLPWNRQQRKSLDVTTGT